MRGAAMSLTAAVSGLVVFLLSVSVVQGLDGWGVTCSSTEICAVKGSTLEINCSYTYRSTWDDGENTGEKTFWFTKKEDGERVDLTTDAEYAGRVEDLCENNICTLRIRNLTESDSAEYRFKFTTNLDVYLGYPVTLSVTDLQLQVSRSGSSTHCLNSCPPGHTSYIWFKNRQEVKGNTSPYAYFTYESADSYSCALKGYEEFPSPAVYAPKLPSVSVSPSADMEEGSSVTLTCSSDANPAANYTWYKEDEDSPKASGQVFTITDFRAEHSGSYSCGAQNKLGRSNSTLTQIVAKGPWRLLPFVTIPVVLLAVISLSFFLWIRKKRASRDSSELEQRPGNREEPLPDQGQREQQDDLQYSTVHFSNNRAEPLYSNMRAGQHLGHTEPQEATEYAAVNFKSCAPRTRPEDPAELYSVITKIH
ncbi:cell adhesion molecule 2-like [Pseudochaenichthys georgianus]|uniref:cell adhesion molecule 2-like n=1 Tax=Pseudochaenichthys georgianus TaxID=52239 RepID=UPI00146E27B4|nr:sialic acid-binding Ig-like lectin 10 [Pseudochaenichthys georgianus]